MGNSSLEETTGVFVDLYRLVYRAGVFRIPKEYFFWLVAIRLLVESQVSPDALVCQKDYLGPLWERRDAIWQKHGWPEEDDEGEVRSPEGHVDPVPGRSYGGFSAERLRTLARPRRRPPRHAPRPAPDG